MTRRRDLCLLPQALIAQLPEGRSFFVGLPSMCGLALKEGPWWWQEGRLGCTAHARERNAPPAAVWRDVSGECSKAPQPLSRACLHSSVLCKAVLAQGVTA